MTRSFRAALIFVAAGVLAACSGSGPSESEGPRDDGFADDRERFSYVLGVDFGQRLGPVAEELDIDLVVQGLEDMLAGREPQLSDREAAAQREQLGRRIQDRRRQEQVRLAEQNLELGEAFLAERARQPDVQVAESGLQYRVIREGDGPRPRLRDRVRVHYRGALIDGTEFDSSIARGEPAEFALNGVIQGWAEALQRMPVGSKYELFVPPHLGYREQGSGPLIGPNATLVFEVELLAILD